MSQPPETRPSLLIRLRETRDAEAWSQFVQVYAPLIYGFARKHGLQDADAADVTQDVLCSVASAIRNFQYDRQRGRFRGWLLTVVRNNVRNFVTRQDPVLGTGNTDVQALLKEHPASEQEQAAWEWEYKQSLFDCAANQVRGSVEEPTWQAFWQTAVEGRRPSDVAQHLGMSVANVYRAKSRVVIRLREQIHELEADD
jgi:RNA polymerase sigma factor (sigma-70 family)